MTTTASSSSPDSDGATPSGSAQHGIATLTGSPSPPRPRDGRDPARRPSSGSAIRPSSSSHFTRTGERRVELLARRGAAAASALLPQPSPGDVWLDLEGHPFYEPARGLEYLFGWCYRDEAASSATRSLWGADREGEKAAFERFVDWVERRRRVYPDLHVYHYAAYERTALRRLMGEHATREREIDDLLRSERARRPLPRRAAGAAGRR